MSSNLHGFDVRLEFDPDGGVDKVFYWDAGGCGHEQEMDTYGSIGALVDYHLSHYRRSHDEFPQPVCDEWVALPYDEGVLRCTVPADQHHDQHVFTWRKR